MNYGEQLPVNFDRGRLALAAPTAFAPAEAISDRDRPSAKKKVRRLRATTASMNDHTLQQLCLNGGTRRKCNTAYSRLEFCASGRRESFELSQLEKLWNKRDSDFR